MMNYLYIYMTVCQWLATGRWFSLGTPVSSTNKTVVESGVKHHKTKTKLYQWHDVQQSC